MQPYTRLVSFVQEMRRHILLLLVLIAAGTVFFYSQSSFLLTRLQAHLDQPLVFYTVAEPFLAHVQLALSANILFLLPVFAAFFWKTLGKTFHLSRLSQALFILFTCLLFYAGALFCYELTLPYGVRFLLSFGSEQLKPIISIGKFVTFVTVFVLAFGLIFELPLTMIFSGKTGIVSRKKFENGRRYAILVISIVAALLTPTPDVVNMMLMGGPLYLLYEMGIFSMRVLNIN